MPTVLELELMTAHCRNNGLAVVPTTGDGLPLITYWGPVNDASVKVNAATGQNIRAACLALRHGIGPDGWSDRIFNLNLQCNDHERLAAGAWEAGWNGVWIHQGHGFPGGANLGTMSGGIHFYFNFACHILHRDRFRYGLMKTCRAAQKAGSPERPEPSLIEAIAQAASDEVEGSRPRLYGARGITWVPVSGVGVGRPVLSFKTFINHQAECNLRALALDPDEDDDDRCKARRLAYDNAQEAAIATLAGLYYPGGIDENFRIFRQRPVEELDRLAGGLNAAYFDAAAFDTTRARSLAAAPEPPFDDEEDITWCGVNL